MSTIINLDEEIKTYFEDLGTPANEIKKATPLEWLGCLCSIGQTFFSGDALKISAPDVNNMITLKYIDVYKLYYLCIEYINCSCKYNKIISYKDFSDLANISHTTIYNYKNIKVFKDTNINDLLDSYNTDINNYYIYINDYNINKDINIFNNAICIYNKYYNSDTLNILRLYIYNKLHNKAQQTLYKKIEGSGQGFGYALMLNNNTEYQQETNSNTDNTISISNLQNKLQIAQKHDNNN